MRRFFGMMPNSEIKTENLYIDKNGHKIILQAGEHGWTVLFSDGSSAYKDENNDIKSNLQNAYIYARNSLGKLHKYSNKCC